MFQAEQILVQFRSTGCFIQAGWMNITHLLQKSFEKLSERFSSQELLEIPVPVFIRSLAEHADIDYLDVLFSHYAVLRETLRYRTKF
mmetsp:Transcript_2653/g.6252  ORF Transcript_2653/g.6252 Transcript_2653/m.6252 type:complete len:87 (-) Transcript_2653:265-525(-)